MRATTTSFVAACFIGLALPANAEPPWVFADDIRYMALRDSLAAGYGAQPVTQGYVYRLYQRGVFERTLNTFFANDLLVILGGADPNTVLMQFQNNLIAILASPRAVLPDSEILVGNLYSISEIPGADTVVPILIRS